MPTDWWTSPDLVGDWPHPHQNIAGNYFQLDNQRDLNFFTHPLPYVNADSHLQYWVTGLTPVGGDVFNRRNFNGLRSLDPTTVIELTDDTGSTGLTDDTGTSGATT